MRINKLELFGFKSFPDRTAFEFGEGISCVVGPNGSGKSNVVDALRWVIGEQSARSLRGKDMSDVIFAGSSVRNPVGFAEVTLTLGVGDGDPFPGDYASFEELEVGRRLYRDGTSEYRINQVKARRRDIVDLFLDTGVGANLYSFIAQGQVDRIVNQSAGERRALIDEAAGISRYKVRRDEAQVRLAATATQLDRAADVADEMGRRLKVLERQVLRAGRYRRLRARIRQHELALAVVKYAALADERRAVRRRLRELTDQAGATARTVERLEAERHTREAELRSVQEAVRTWRDEAAELEAQRREQEGAARLYRARRTELLEAVERSARRAADAAERADQLVRQAATLAERRNEAEAELAAIDLDGAEATAQAAAAALTAAATALEVARTEHARLDARRASLDEARARWLDAPVEVPPEPAPVMAELAQAAAARERLDEAGAAEAQAAERAQLVQAALREEQRARDAAIAAHQAALRAWERTRAERDARREVLTRAAAAAARSAEQQHRRRTEAWRREALARHAAWLAAARAELQRRRATVEAWLREQRRDLDDVRDRARSQLDAGAVARAQAARDQVPGEALAQAERELDEARARLDDARRRAEAAEAAHAGARAHAASLDAEWEALERRRTEAIPAEWRERPLLADRLTGDAPLAEARPELLGLPVLGPDERLPERGRAMWWGQGPAWRIVDTAAEAWAALRAHGPPVASRDGGLRVDADGYVEVGFEAGSRWAALRDARPAAAQAVEVAAAAATAASAALGAATDARADCAARLEAARRQRQQAQEEAAAAVRADIEAERERIGREHQQAEREATRQAEVALATLDRARADSERLAAQARDVVTSSSPPAVEAAPFLAAALARAWPAALAERPELPPQPTPDATPVERADTALQQARAARDAARAGFEAAEDALRQATAARDAALARRVAALQEVERRQQALDALDAQLEALPPAPPLAPLVAARDEAEAVAAAARETQRERHAAAATLRERVVALGARAEGVEAERAQAAADADAALAEAARNQTDADEAGARADEASRLADARAEARAEVQARLAEDAGREERLTDELRRLDQRLEAARSEQVEVQAGRAEAAATVERLQLEIEGLRKRMTDRYQVSLPGLLDRLGLRGMLRLDPDEAVIAELRIGDEVLEPVAPLELTRSLLDDEEAVVAMVEALKGWREALQGLREVNLAAEAEYTDLRDRHDDLLRQRDDLERSVASIRAAIAKMNRTCRERFRDAYDRVNEAFQRCYPELVGGGDARLALTDDEDLLETGVDIFVRPPGKRLQNLTLLSGGEKAMTAIALLLAIFQVRPSPFCVLDEVDAPLDEANGARFNEMIRSMSSMSQFIVITHNRKTMECADVLYGVTMAAPGVSTLVSVALEGRRS